VAPKKVSLIIIAITSSTA